VEPEEILFFRHRYT